MKILQVNKFLFPQGGADAHFLALVELLKKHGHQVTVFSQKDPRNVLSEQKEFLISKVALDRFHLASLPKIGRIFWSFKAAQKIKKLIRHEQPEIVHLHNIYHQISPSILPAIKKFGLPIVMTVHDFKLIKPDYTLWLTEKHRGKNFLARQLMHLEFWFHKKIKIYQKNIDLFIAPSNFVKTQLVNHGFDERKIIVLPHFVASPTPIIEITPEPSTEKNYFLFFGRLDPSKGVENLIRAYAQTSIPLNFKIAGTGPEEKNLRQLVAKLGISERVEFLGLLDKKDLFSAVSQATFTVFPSLVEETFGLGIIESYASGKPVIASRAGAFTELVTENETGYLFNPLDVSDIAATLEKISADTKNIKFLGEQAKIKAQNYEAENYYQKLMAIYQSLVK